MKHVFHQLVGAEVAKLNSDSVKVILDPACMDANLLNIEHHNIPLFSDKKTSATELCNVDILIKKGGKVKVIIEIDYSDTKPTQICGKYLTSALSNLYQYNQTTISIPSQSVLFIQVADTSKLPKQSKKLAKYQLIQTLIGKMPYGIIKEYCLLTDENYKKISNVITHFLSNN